MVNSSYTSVEITQCEKRYGWSKLGAFYSVVFLVVHFFLHDDDSCSHLPVTTRAPPDSWIHIVMITVTWSVIFYAAHDRVDTSLCVSKYMTFFLMFIPLLPSTTWAGCAGQRGAALPAGVHHL